ncbi:MAG: YndJ family transporter [Planctomycetes bacterium]|nr:YndJ family transporter [Planctomycetota bacterium]
MPAKARQTPAWARAALGGVIGLACWAWFAPPLHVALVWIGALVHVPLALGLMQEPRVSAKGPAPGDARPVAYASGSCLRYQLPAALMLVASFVSDSYGIWLALPWLGFNLWLVVLGGLRLAKLGLKRPGALADFGLVVTLASGLAIAAYHLAWEVAGFSLLLVLLTAAHQLFIGAVLLGIAAQIVAWRPGRLPWLAALGVAIGNPLVATGIFITGWGGPPVIEFLAVCLFAGSVIVLGWMQLWLAVWPRSGLRPLARVLLVISDLSLGTAMTLAIIYAWGTARGMPTLYIPEMIQWHATLQVFGFGLCGLAGWTVAGKVNGQQLKVNG